MVEVSWYFGGMFCLHLQGPFYPENGGTTFLQNVSNLEADYTVPHLRKQQASVTIARTQSLATDKMFHIFLTVCVSENCCRGT